MAEDREWQQVSLDQLEVTTGKREVQQTASGFLPLDTAKTRAQLKAGLQRHVRLQFRYRGQTPDPEPNQSGEVVEQIGIKLRTLNTCNVVYVMWRITQPEGIVVKLKRNLGQSHHKECGTNRYRSGLDSMGWHADDEPEMGNVIGSLSLGATRKFRIRHNVTRETKTFLAGHGTLIIMAGTMQQFWQHEVPKTKQVVGERINLTFRKIIKV